jgi:hypothetical protein
MHNELTLSVMDDVTESLGNKLREFQDTTCSAFVTRELERECNARTRRQASKTAGKKKQPVSKHPHPNARPSRSIADVDSEDPAVASGEQARSRRLKAFNLNTYKAHALGDYTATIRRFGTTDSYSTEPVSSFNCQSL